MTVQQENEQKRQLVVITSVCLLIEEKLEDLNVHTRTWQRKVAQKKDKKAKSLVDMYHIVKNINGQIINDYTDKKHSMGFIDTANAVERYCDNMGIPVSGIDTVCFYCGVLDKFITSRSSQEVVNNLLNLHNAASEVTRAYFPKASNFLKYAKVLKQRQKLVEYLASAFEDMV